MRASVVPCRMPVSCTGKKPFGISMYSATVSTTVPVAIHSTSVWWSSTRISQPIVAGDQALEGALGLARDRALAALLGSPAAVRSILAHSIGTSVSDTTAEIRIAIDKRDGEFAKQPPDHLAHEQQRDQHRDQRDRSATRW